MPAQLAIDQGTANTRALLVDAAGLIHARASAPLASANPKPGWAEQSATALWASVQTVIAAIVAQASASDMVAIAIAHQREMLVVCDAVASKPIAPAIRWQCRRSTGTCAALRQSDHNAAVERATGLAINPLFFGQ